MSIKNVTVGVEALEVEGEIFKLQKSGGGGGIFGGSDDGALGGGGGGRGLRGFAATCGRTPFIRILADVDADDGSCISHS